MILDKSQEDEINLLVAKYLEQINSKLTKKFSEAANLPPLSERDQTSEVSLETVVQYYIETGGGKRKCSEDRSGGERNDKKQRLEEQTAVDEAQGGRVGKKNEAKKKQEERKTVFIRNIGKKFNFEKHRGRFEAFGKSLGFTNSGKGFGFLTFASEEAAQTCIETLNSTEIDGNIIKMNIARGKQGKEDGESESCKLFVHGVKQEVSESEIKQEFSKYGSVEDCFNPGKGFAFVTFRTKEEAEVAVEELQGKEMFGGVLSLNVSKPKEKTEEKTKPKKKKTKKKKVESEQSRLFVKNIDKDADMDEIRKIFGAHGTCLDLYNPGKGFMFVSYSSPSEAQAAAEALDGENVKGRVIECNIAKFQKGGKKKRK